MKKTLATLIVIIFSASFLFAQDETQTSENYSESKSYRPDRTQPTKFVRGQKKKIGKKKKEKQPDVEKIIDVEKISKKSNRKPVQNNKVLIPISVYDEQGVFVTNINQTEIEVFENGAKQEIKSFGDEKDALNIIFLIDLSPSTEYLVKDIQKSLKNFVETSDKRFNIILTGFDENFKVYFDKNEGREKLLKAINKLKFGAGTSVYDAIGNLHSRVLQNLNGQSIVVFISDAVDTTSKSIKYEKSLEIAEESNAQFLGIYINSYKDFSSLKPSIKLPRATRSSSGIVDLILSNLGQGSGTSEEEYAIGYQYIYELTASTGGGVYEIGTEKNAFEAAFKDVQNKINQQTFIHYESNSDFGGRKDIKVRVTRPNLIVRIRDNYYLN